MARTSVAPHPSKKPEAPLQAPVPGVLEIVQPLALLLTVLSLYAVFHAAFLTPASTFDDRIEASLLRLLFAAAIALVSGLLFREAAHPTDPQPTLLATLPIRIFLWTTAILLLLFAASWYLETYCIFYKDVRRY